MAKYLKLQVPSSCLEDWNKMAPEKKERYCFSCQKSVVDFTQMTDNELIEYFTSPKGSTCGRFTESQLNRDILIPKKPLPWVKYFFKFSLPAFLLSLKSSVQAQQIRTPIEVAPIKPKASVVDSSKQLIVITGIVSDEKGIPLPGASILVKSTNKGASTDAQGHFILNDVAVPVTLLISFVGYLSTEVKISSDQQGTEIKLQLAPALMGEVIVVGYISPKKIKSREKKENKKHEKASTASPSILAYPNPVIAGSILNLQCRSLERGSYNAELFTLLGQLVQTTKVTYGKEDSQIILPIAQILSGTYLLRLTHEKSGKHLNQQVVVQN